MPHNALPPSGLVLSRRSALGAALAGTAALLLPGCATLGRMSLEDAVRRLLFVSSERAFARMLGPDGFWDEAVATLGLPGLLGTRGGVLANILTSALFKERLEGAFADIAFDAAERAAPVVTDAVRVIGYENAVALLRGREPLATALLEERLGGRLIEVMVPELGDALRLAGDPLVREALAGLTGVDLAGATRNFAARIDAIIWDEIAREEAAIRADPLRSGDALLADVLRDPGG